MPAAPGRRADPIRARAVRGREVEVSVFDFGNRRPDTALNGRWSRWRDTSSRLSRRHVPGVHNRPRCGSLLPSSPADVDPLRICAHAVGVDARPGSQPPDRTPVSNARCRSAGPALTRDRGANDRSHSAGQLQLSRRLPRAMVLDPPDPILSTHVRSPALAVRIVDDQVDATHFTELFLQHADEKRANPAISMRPETLRDPPDHRLDRAAALHGPVRRVSGQAHDRYADIEQGRFRATRPIHPPVVRYRRCMSENESGSPAACGALDIASSSRTEIKAAKQDPLAKYPAAELRPMPPQR